MPPPSYLKTLGKHKAENKPFVEVLFENVPPREDTDHEEDIQILGCNSVFPFRSYLRLPPLLTESMHSLRHFPLRKHALVCFSRYISDDGRIPRWRRYSDVDPVKDIPATLGTGKHGSQHGPVHAGGAPGRADRSPGTCQGRDVEAPFRPEPSTFCVALSSLGGRVSSGFRFVCLAFPIFPHVEASHCIAGKCALSYVNRLSFKAVMHAAAGSLAGE